MKHIKNRLKYALITLFVVIIGLASRHFSHYLPEWINFWLGDSLWAVMVYFIFRSILITSSLRQAAIYSLLFSYAIEISQLYHSAWIDTIRHTRFGGLVLGFGFLWSDMVAYTVGIAMAVVVDYFLTQ
jgi:hypothetical protein